MVREERLDAARINELAIQHRRVKQLTVGVVRALHTSMLVPCYPEDGHHETIKSRVF